MAKTSVFALLAALLFLGGGSASAQSGADVAKVALTEDEKLFAADPATYVSGAKYELQWSPVRENDILWRKRVHRTIDASLETNRALTGSSGESFFALLLEAVKEGKIKAYANERFVRPLTNDETEVAIISSRVSKFQLREDWLYLRDGRELVGRIIGIAPVREGITAAGETEAQPLFWIYYPELRPFLRSHGIDENNAAIPNLDQWFEGRRFASSDVKTVYEQAPPRLR